MPTHKKLPAANGPTVSGFALLEVLLSIALINVGLLGGLNLLAYQGSVQSEHHLRLLAYLLNADLVRKMDALDLPPARWASAEKTPPNAPSCWKQSCSSTALRDFLLAHWRCHFTPWQDHARCRHQRLAHLHLPQASGAIQTSGEGLLLRLQWQNARGERETLQLPYRSPHP